MSKVVLYNEDIDLLSDSGLVEPGGDNSGSPTINSNYVMYFVLYRDIYNSLLKNGTDLSSILLISYKSEGIEKDAVSAGYCNYSIEEGAINLSDKTNTAFCLKVSVNNYSESLYLKFFGGITDPNNIDWYYPASKEIKIEIKNNSVVSATKGGMPYTDNVNNGDGNSKENAYTVLFASDMYRTPSGQVSIHLPSNSDYPYGDPWDVSSYGDIEFVSVSGNTSEVTCEKMSDSNNIFNVYTTNADKSNNLTLTFKMVKEPYNSGDVIVNFSQSYNASLVINPVKQEEPEETYAYEAVIYIKYEGMEVNIDTEYIIEYFKDAVTGEKISDSEIKYTIGHTPYEHIKVSSKYNKPIRVRVCLKNDPKDFGWLTIDKNSGTSGNYLNIIHNKTYQNSSVNNIESYIEGSSYITKFKNNSVFKKTFNLPGYKPVSIWMDYNTPKLNIYLEADASVVGEMDGNYNIRLNDSIGTGTYTLRYEDSSNNVLDNYEPIANYII